MGNGFWLAVGQMCQLCFWTVRYLPQGGWRQLPRRSLMFGLAVPVLIFFQMLHWLGFALDELFFRRYLKAQVKAPIFVTGIPRSGTTHLQRVLATHDHLSCMRTWECVLAPSISERYFYCMLGRLFQPAARGLSHLKLPFFKRMQAIHSFGLRDAEEDFIALMPINACFLLVLLFPGVEHYWNLSQFDQKLDEKEQRKILKFYFRLVQKHQFFHGEQLRYLSKNPSFLMWVKGLKRQFPDASFVLCEREPSATVPSQISSLQPVWQLLYGQAMPEHFQQRLVAMLAAYYHYLEHLPLSELHAMRVPMAELVSDLESIIRRVQRHTHLPATDVFQQSLAEQVNRAKNYRSQHQYSNPLEQNGTWPAEWFPKKYHATLEVR